MEDSINIFCVNTPFQLYIVRTIIKNYFSKENNTIVSTFKDKKYNDLIIIKKNSLKEIKILKKYIIHNINKIKFFIPHLGSFFASYFYSLSIRYNRPINIFYEGLALFYNPVRHNRITAIKRYIYGVFCGIRYRHYKELYPDHLIAYIDCCYSPIIKGLEKYKKVIPIHCDINCCKKIETVTSCMIILSPKLSNVDIALILDSLAKHKSYDVVYVKPHYELRQTEIIKLCTELDKNGVKYETIDKSIPIELFFKDVNIKKIISLHFSSAIINIRLLFKSNIAIEVIHKNTIPYVILEKLQLSI